MSDKEKLTPEEEEDMETVDLISLQDDEGGL